MNFDLDKTIYMFTAGRYEFTNKGGDFFIEALARLNYKLQVRTFSGYLCPWNTVFIKISERNCKYSWFFTRPRNHIFMLNQ